MEHTISKVLSFQPAINTNKAGVSELLCIVSRGLSLKPGVCFTLTSQCRRCSIGSSPPIVRFRNIYRPRMLQRHSRVFQ